MFNKILVPLDGSILAERALEPALALARHSRGELTLLRVPIPERALCPPLPDMVCCGPIKLSNVAGKRARNTWNP